MGVKIGPGQITIITKPMASSTKPSDSPSAKMAKQTLLGPQATTPKPLIDKQTTYSQKFPTRLIFCVALILGTYFYQRQQSLTNNAIRFGELQKALDNGQCELAKDMAKSQDIDQHQALLLLDDCLANQRAQILKAYADQLTDDRAKSLVYGKAIAANSNVREAFNWISPEGIPNSLIRDSVIADFVPKTAETDLKKMAIKKMSHASLQIPLVKETYEDLFYKNVTASFEILSMMSESMVKFDALGNFAKECPKGELRLEAVEAMKWLVTDIPYLVPSYNQQVKMLVKQVVSENEQLAYGLAEKMVPSDEREEMFFYLGSNFKNLELRELAIDNSPFWTRKSLYSRLVEEHRKDNRTDIVERLSAKLT